jgi:cytochrome P450 family 2 subfamily U polypeptide 1
MLEFILFVLVVALLLLVFALRYLRRDLSALPPGPPDHFIFGNAKYMAEDNPLDVIAQACWKFGNKGMMRFRYPFQEPIVFVYKPDTIIELFEKHGEKLNDRDILNISLDEITASGKDIFMGNGEYWRVARKMFLQGVISSVGRSIPIIEKHIKIAIETMKSKDFAVQELRGVLSLQTFSVICDMSIGRIPLSEEIAKEFLSVNERIDAYLSPLSIRNIIPGYKFLPIKDNFRKLLARRDELVLQNIEEHRRTLDRENPVDFLDHIIVESEKEGTLSVSLLHILLDAFIAGTDTSSISIEFFIGYLANNPEIQLKVHEEIDANIKGRFPTLEDEENLPYLSAVLREVLRIAPVAGLMLRLLPDEIRIQGYTIPKGSKVCFFNHAILHDPELWVNPNEFRLDRFMEEEKDVIIRGGELLKSIDQMKSRFFGYGRRVCPGLPLARKELFLQVVYYLWAFEFSTPVQSEKIDLTMEMGLLSKPKIPVRVRAKYRQK